MNKLSKLVQINIYLTLFFLIVGVFYPKLKNSLFYATKAKEAESLCEIIERGQNNIYTKTNRYKKIKRGDIATLTSNEFNINKIDIKYYDYLVTTTPNSFTIEAIPKKKYLFSRSINPKIYIYQKILNKKAKKSWK